MSSKEGLGACVVARLGERAKIPDGGVLSRTLYAEPAVSVILYALDRGQHVQDRSATRRVLAHVLEGEVEVEVDGQTLQASGGSLFVIPPHRTYRLLAHSPLVLLLYLFCPRTPEATVPALSAPATYRPTLPLDPEP